MKQLTSLILTLTILLTMTACKTEAPNPGGATADVSVEPATEITVVTSYGGDDGNRQNYERAVRAYEANTGNTVLDNSGISGEEWKARVLDSFEDGNEPDVLFFFTGADAIPLIESNKVVPLDEIRALYPDYASNMRDDMLPVSPDGKNYAIPVNGYWEALYVNKRVLAECGVEIPNAETTWEEFLEDCQKIADNGYIPIAASLGDVPHYWFEFCVLNNGSVQKHLELPSPSSPVNEIWAAGLNDIKNLFDRGFFPPDTLSTDNATVAFLMTDNKAAFMIEGSWKMGWFAENASDINNFTITYIPGKNDRKATDIIGGISMGYFITRKAWDNFDKRDACIGFITSMTSDSVVATFGLTAVTALKTNPTPPPDANNFTKDALSMTNNRSNIVPAAADNLPPATRAALFADIPRLLQGDVTANEIISSYFE